MKNIMMQTDNKLSVDVDGRQKVSDTVDISDSTFSAIAIWYRGSARFAFNCDLVSRNGTENFPCSSTTTSANYTGSIFTCTAMLNSSSTVSAEPHVFKHLHTILILAVVYFAIFIILLLILKMHHHCPCAGLVKRLRNYT